MKHTFNTALESLDLMGFVQPSIEDEEVFVEEAKEVSTSPALRDILVHYGKKNPAVLDFVVNQPLDLIFLLTIAYQVGKLVGKDKASTSLTSTKSMISRDLAHSSSNQD